MRAVVYVPLSCVVASLLAIAACGSDPAAPEIDPGKSNEEGGTNLGGNAGNAGSTQAPDYPKPAAGFGQNVDSIARDYEFSGLMNPKLVAYKADDTTMKKVYLHDFYNPTKDPKRPRVMLLTWSALWCSVCQTQAETAMEEYNAWHPKGVEFMEAIFEDANYNDSKPADLATWTKTYKFEFPAVLDSGIASGVYFDQSAAPFNMVIDLSTMRIAYAQAGYFGADSAEAEFSSVLGL